MKVPVPPVSCDVRLAASTRLAEAEERTTLLVAVTLIQLYCRGYIGAERRGY